MAVYGKKLQKVTKAEIPYYVDDDLWACITLWNRWKDYGLPFTGGWAEQPAHLVDAIEGVEQGVREWNSRNTG